MKKFGFERTLAVLILVLSTIARPTAQDNTPAPQATTPTDSTVSEAYRLAPGDGIEVRSFFNPEFNDTVQIRPDGRISMQLIGEVKVGGLAVREAEALMEQLYSKDLRTPRFSIQVRSFAGLRVFITGEVVRPGPINMPGQMTLLEAISEAGGPKPTADGKTVVLIRKGKDGQPEGRRVTPYLKNNKQVGDAILLQPFDVVVVPESRITRIDRWVDQHIRSLSPAVLSLGFAYIMQNSSGGASSGVPLVPLF
jgi:polysaccharide export outer membrane protein